ncbi:MAG: DUF6263 family protein [Ignavibacteria bacterium]|nr:DUF6263 family protein [Ignavibacteria bacterium]
MLKFPISVAIVILSLCFIISCNKKDDPGTVQNTSKSEFIIKDSVTGAEKVILKYKVKKGDVFKYKMIAKTSNMEKSPATEDKEIKQDNEINYFYTKEVLDVDESGIANFKVTFDSITISSKMDEESIFYNSNVNDSVRENPAFIQYNAIINNPFYMRVSPQGEINDVYGLEKVFENLFKALGDTLDEREKMEIKQQFGQESIKEILQQEYQICPKDPLSVDSSWTKSFTTTVLFFEVLNNAKYTLKGIDDKNGNILANIEALLNVEFKNKEVKERGMKIAIADSETTGSGKISINLNKGCIQSKETSTTLRLDLKLSAGGQSAMSSQGVTTNLIVQLLN